MSDKRITEMTAATSLAGADILPVVQGGANKKITVANIFGKINTPVVINEALLDQDTRIAGDNDANLVFVDASTDKVGVGTATPSEKLEVNGGIKLTGLFKNASVDTQTSAGVISLLTATTIVSSAAPAAMTLAAGSAGQYKTIVADNVGPVTVTVANPQGFTTLTFATDGGAAELLYIGAKWFVISARNVTVA